MLLSACLIVKDEDFTITRCLESLVGIADEIIVVDTGSTDRTVEIAESYGAKVFPFTWDNNFSNARNESLRHAQGQFILIIDADEYLDPTEKLQLRDFLHNTDAEGLYVNVKNYVGSIARITEVRPVLLLRIFRRGHFYTGSVHEQIIYSIAAANRPIASCELTIHHLGYLDEVVRFHHKIDRNLALIHKELEDKPDDVFHRCNLMAEYIRQREFDKCLPLARETIEWVKRNPQPLIDHLIIRIQVFYSICLWEKEQRGEAINAIKTTIADFPQIADPHFRLGHMLFLENRWYDAVAPLMQCRSIGEPQGAFFDTIEGAGSYLAAAELAQAWTHLGDEFSARDWFLKAFFENPKLPLLSFDLVFLLRDEHKALMESVEPRIAFFADEYRNFAEQCAVLGLPEAQSIIDRAEAKCGSSAVTDRARMALLRRHGTAALEVFVANKPTEDKQLLLGIHYMENEHPGAVETLAKAGSRGEYLIKARDLFQTGQEMVWEATLFIRDLIAMDAQRTLSQWLPYAKDRAECWTFMQHSALRNILTEIAWPGNTVHECEHNALRCFGEHDLQEAAEWLEKAMVFPPTVTKILIECDLALAYKNLPYAQRTLHFGQVLFPDSKLLRQVQHQLGAFQPVTHRLEDLLMNPADIYRTRAIQTMPLNIQLAQLHERGAVLTKQIQQDAQAGRTQEARANIEELQNIITFLRASLNPTLEVSAVTDSTYAFYYKTTVRWFVHPDSIAEDYEDMLGFWESWAQTWMKVRATNND